MDLYSVRQKLNMGISLSSMPLRVTDYSRVSTDNEKQQKSLKNQIEHFDEMIKNNPNWTYIPGYVDDGISGTTDYKRDKFMQMIDDAKKGKFDLIITKEISRFSRNTLDSIKYTRELLNYGVAVLFVSDNINTALPDSELRLTIMASMAQDEVRRLSERVKFGMNRAQKRGEILGNDMLYGYKKDPKTGNLKIITNESKIVQRIFSLYIVDKMSLCQIAKLLNRENLKSSQGKKWSVSSLSRMIENPKYKGYYCAHKSEIVDYMTKKVKHLNKDDWISYEDYKKVPPIISKMVWEKANKRLAKRKKTKNKVSNHYLYSTKIICEHDGSFFHRRKFCKSSRDITWVCSCYLKNGKKACDMPNIRESELSVIFRDLISFLNIKPQKAVDILLNYYQKDLVANGYMAEVKTYQDEINSISIKKDKILELNMEGALSNKEFKEKNDLLNSKKSILIQKINDLKNKKAQGKDNLEHLKNKLMLKVNSNALTENIIKLLLGHITVNKINTSNDLALKIFLTYKNKMDNPFYTQTYTFKRGYNTQKAKRYVVRYKVDFYY